MAERGGIRTPDTVARVPHLRCLKPLSHLSRDTILRRGIEERLPASYRTQEAGRGRARGLSLACSFDKSGGGWSCRPRRAALVRTAKSHLATTSGATVLLRPRVEW